MDKDVADTLQVMTLETRAGFAEVKSLLAESRARDAELRSDIVDIKTRLDTLFVALAEFRSEYQAHTHGEAA